MTTVTHHARIKLRGTSGQSESFVKVRISGRSSLNKFAGIVEGYGNPTLAATIRKSGSFTIRLSPEDWAKIEKEFGPDAK